MLCALLHPGGHEDPDAFPDCPAIPRRSPSKQATAFLGCPVDVLRGQVVAATVGAGVRDACTEGEIVQGVQQP